MTTIELAYDNLTPTQYYLKLNTIVIWLIENEIDFQMYYKYPSDDSVAGVVLNNDEDATLLMLMFSL